MDNLTERLLDPKTFEEALETRRFVKDPILLAYDKAIRELHRLLATANKYAAAPVDKGIPMHVYRAVCEQRDYELGERQRMTHRYEVEALRNKDLEERLSTAKAEGAAEREDTVRLADSWRPVDLGPKGEWFMGRLKDGTEKWLRRLPVGSSYEYSDVTFTYYSWYWLTHWRPLADAEQAAIDSARAGGGK